MSEEVIQIEICRSEYKPNSFNMRIGDIKGSAESSNFSKEDILKEISDEIDELKEKQYSESDIKEKVKWKIKIWYMN